MPTLTKLALATALSLALLAGCKGATPPPTVGMNGAATPAPAGPRSEPRAAGLFATGLGKISEGVSGPYLAASSDRVLSLTGVDHKDGLALLAQPLEWDGKKSGDARAVATVAGAVSLLSLKAVSRDLFAAVLATKTERGHIAYAALIGADGAPRGKLLELHQSAEPILWVEAVGAGDGVVVFVASGSGTATIRSSVLDKAGTVASTASPVATGARAWDVTATTGGPLLVFLTREGEKTRVQAQSLDASGKLSGPTITIAEGARIAEDVEVVDTGDGAVAAWAEGERGEGRVVVARLAGGKLLGAPRAAAESAGDQALVGLEASNGKVLVAWEDGGAPHRTARRIELAALSSDLGTELGRTHMSLGTRDAGPPLMVPTAEGFAFLGLARACAAGAPSCAEAPIVPVYVKASSDLGRVTATPLFVDRLGGEAPDGAWALACSGKGCVAAASGPDELFALSLEGKLGEITPPIPEARRSDAPGVRVHDVLRGPRIASTSRARLASSWLFATVTEHAEGAPPPPLPPDVDARAEAEKDRLHQKDPKRGSKRGAIVRIVPLDDRGGAAAAVTLSVRALSTGGVAIAPSAAADEAVVAWVARDDGDPQVFLTRVGADGKKRGQTMLTTAKGDVSEVALTAVSDGYLVAWVDERDGNGEVYTARVDKNLRKLGPDQRITNAKGDASSLALHVSGAEAWLAFSDARGIESGAGDVFLAKLDVAKGTKKGEEQRLASTTQHARALRFAVTSAGVALLFVDSPPAMATGGSFLRRVALSPTGDAQPSTALTLPPAWDPTSLDVACEPAQCRVALVRRSADGLTLAGGSMTREGTLALRDFMSLLSPPGTSHDPMIAGDAVLVGDDAAIPGEGRLRRIGVRWK